MYEHLGDDLASLFPEQTKTPLRIVVWSILLILDLLAGAAVTPVLGLSIVDDGFRGILALAVMAAVTAGLFWVESTIWKAFLKIFR